MVDGTRHAFVTGASSGIGRAASTVLLESGYMVTAIDRSKPALNGVTWIQHDLNDMSSDVPSLPAPVDVLVNAAGLPPRVGTEAMVLRVNFLALRRLTETIIDDMAPGARIVNVASKAGAKWHENLPQVERFLALPDDRELEQFVRDESIDAVRSYDLSKEAVIVWTKAMTAPLLELGLRMNAVSPGAVETPILPDFVDAFGARALKGIEMTKGTGQASDIAKVIAFLASPDSHWLRGCNIDSDGGLTAMLEAEKTISWRP